MKSSSGSIIAAALLVVASLVTQRELGGATQSPGRDAAEVFVVTSTRDAGPGTLRDAILAADRLTTRAHIQIAVARVAVDSALPALTNPHGVDIDTKSGAVTIDAQNQPDGVVLQINSPTSTLHALNIVHARGTGLIVNAAGVELASLAVSDSGVGLLLAPTARGSTIRATSFERDQTGVLAEPGVRGVTFTGSTFADNTRAAFWSVSAAHKAGATQQGPDEAAAEREDLRILDSTFTRNVSGVVLANQPTLIQKSHFVGNRDSAVLVLGGAARVEDTDITGTSGTAVSITSGHAVQLVHNTLVDNPATAIKALDSDVTIERNDLRHNGIGIVSVVTLESVMPVVRDNTITQSTGDALVVIGGPTLLQRNQVLQNHGAALRALDLVAGSHRVAAAPRLDANIFKGNAIDVPLPGVYTQASTP